MWCILLCLVWLIPSGMARQRYYYRGRRSTRYGRGGLPSLFFPWAFLSGRLDPFLHFLRRFLSSPLFFCFDVVTLFPLPFLFSRCPWEQRGERVLLFHLIYYIHLTSPAPSMSPFRDSNRGKTAAHGLFHGHTKWCVHGCLVARVMDH